MDTNRQLIIIRAKKLGVLLQNARLIKRRSLEECAQATGIRPEILQKYESGTVSPSLPELEALAFYLGVSLDHFWGKYPLSPVGETAADPGSFGPERLRQLRDRVIGTTLRSARERLNLALPTLAEQTTIPVGLLEAYESGTQLIPLAELEVLSRTLQVKMDDLYDQKGPIGKWRLEKQAVERFLELPPQLQQFVTQPVNLPYIDLAMRLNELSVEKLRSIAEGLLEITY